MKLWMTIAALLFGSAAEAAGVLFMRAGVEKTAFCQKYACQRISKRTATSEISPRQVESRYKLKNLDAFVTTRHSIDGYLLSATLTFYRFPLSLEDSAVALGLIKTMVGGTYSERLLERCFDKAEANQDKEYLNEGESLLAGGNHWGVKCQLHSEGTTISELWIFAAD